MLNCYDFMGFIPTSRAWNVLAIPIVALATSFQFATPVALGQITAFSQNFSSSTTVTDYVSATPNTGQFDAIAASGPNTIVSINSGKLRYDRTSNRGMFVRTTDFPSTPSTFWKFSFNFEVAAVSATTSDAIQIQIGDSFLTNTTTAEPNEVVHTKFGIHLIDGTTDGFQLRDIEGGSVSSTFTGSQVVVAFVNNSGATVTYVNPSGASTTVANDRTDVYVGTTAVFNEMVSVTATQFLTNFKMTFTAGTASVEFDNITVDVPEPAAFFVVPAATWLFRRCRRK